MSGLTPNESAIHLSPEQEIRIAQASSAEEIKSLMLGFALEQHLIEPDAFNPSVMHPTPLADHAPKQFAKVVVIDNVKHILQADSPEALVQQETALLKSVFEQPDSEQQARDSNGRFISADDKAAQEADLVVKAELEGRFKRGEISTDDYLLQSGALQRAVVQLQQQDEAVQSEWRRATDAFLQSPEGADWSGGTANLQTAMRLLAENPQLADSEDKVAALVAVWEYMKEHYLVQSNPELEQANQAREQAKRISEARTPEELRAALPTYTGIPRDIWGGR